MSLHPPRHGAYGFDAPYAPILMALGGACLLALSAWKLWSIDALSTRRAIAVFAPGVAALWMFLHAGVFVHTTRTGKFAVWAELLDQLELKGDERLLDIGCGRGAVPMRWDLPATLQDPDQQWQHHARRAPGFHSLAHFGQKGRDAREADRDRLRHARQRQAPPVLFRPDRDVRQEPQLPRSG
jgi:hypothetical protein